MLTRGEVVKNIKQLDTPSSMIRATFYDENEGDLYIQFKNHSIYCYKEVPKGTYDELLKAKSAGKYLDTYVKKDYTFVKIE